MKDSNQSVYRKRHINSRRMYRKRNVQEECTEKEIYKKNLQKEGTETKRIKRVKEKIVKKVNYGLAVLQNNAGISTIEILLILVVLIAIVLIFKNQLVELVNTIFDKITSESAGI